MKATKFANATIIAAIGFFALLLVFSLVKGRPADYTNVVRVVLVVALVLLIISLRLRPAHRVNLSVTLIAFGLALFGAELILERVAEGPYTEKYRVAAKKLKVPWDERSRFQVVDDLRNDGVDAHLALTPLILEGAETKNGVDQLYAFGEISNSTIVMCNELGQWSIYESDEFGFNNPRGIWGQDHIDTVSIGDSFVHGQCVTPEENATALIRNVYKNSLNLGTTGTSMLLQLAVMKEYLGDMTPKAVLWFLFEGNDLPELLTEYNQNARAKKYLGTEYRQNLLSRQEEIDREKKSVSESLLAQRLGRNATLDFLRGRFTLQLMRNEIVSSTRKKEKGSLLINRQGNECPTEIIMPLLEEVLKDGTNFVDSWGGRLYLVYLPAWTRYADPGEACVDDRGDKFLHDQALSVARNVDVPVIDITPAFDAHPDPLSLFPFRLRGHYSEAGYRVVADTILQSPDLRNRLLAD